MATDDKARNIADELAELRAQVEALLKDRVEPTAARVAHQAEGYARQAADEVRHRADQLSGTVREQPLVAILVAGVIGWLIGRVTR